MAICTTCGTETPDGARFCQNCGTALRTANESAEILAGAASSAETPTPYASPSSSPPGYFPTPPPPGVMYPAPPYSLIPGQPFLPARNGKAIAGMWLGIASIFPGIFLNWVGVVIGIIGLIFSSLALRDSGPLSLPGLPPIVRPGRIEAMAGLICSIIGIIASTIFLIYILNNLEKFGVKLPT